MKTKHILKTKPMEQYSGYRIEVMAAFIGMLVYLLETDLSGLYLVHIDILAYLRAFIELCGSGFVAGFCGHIGIKMADKQWKKKFKEDKSKVEEE